MKNKTIFLLLAYLSAGCAQSQDVAPPCSTQVNCQEVKAKKIGCDTNSSGGLTLDECRIQRLDTINYFMDNCSAAIFLQEFNGAIGRQLAGIKDTSALALFFTFPSKMECFEVVEFNN